MKTKITILTFLLLLTGFGCKNVEPVEPPYMLDPNSSGGRGDEEIESDYVGKAKIMKANEKIKVKGKLFNKNAVVNELRTKIQNKEPLTYSFNANDITDSSKRDALIANHIDKCGRIETQNYVGGWPPTINDILNILEEGC